MTHSLGTIAIIPGKGILGGHLVRALDAATTRVRVLCRSQANAERYLTLGASDVLVGDPASNQDVKILADGVDTLVFDAGASLDAIDDEWVEAVGSQGVRHVILLSSLHPLLGTLPFLDACAAAERVLARGRMVYSVLQPGIFMQNLGFLWPAVVAESVLLWPWNPNRSYSLVDLCDVTDVILRLLRDTSIQGATYELAGTVNVSAVALAARISEGLGRRVDARRSKGRNWSTSARAGSVVSWSDETLVGGYDCIDTVGFTGGAPLILRALLNREPRSFDLFMDEWLTRTMNGEGESEINLNMYRSWLSSQL